MITFFLELEGATPPVTWPKADTTRIQVVAHPTLAAPGRTPNYSEIQRMSPEPHFPHSVIMTNSLATNAWR